MPNLTTYAALAEHELRAVDLATDHIARFRESWLPTAVTPTLLAELHGLPTQYVVALYPRMFVQGYNAGMLERVVAQVTRFLDDPKVDPTEKLQFCQTLWHTYRDRWGELETAQEWDVLHEQCAMLGLGGALIQGTYLTKLDVDTLLPLVKLHMIRVTGPAAASVENALYVFTQMILISNLIAVETLRCERMVMEDYDDYDAAENDEYAYGITEIEPLSAATTLFDAHDAFMTEWGLA